MLSGPRYLDLSKSLLYVKCWLVHKDGQGMAEKRADSSGSLVKTYDQNVGVINNALYSMFANAEVFLNHVNVSTSQGLYAFKAYLDNLLVYDSDRADTSGQLEGFFQDDGNMESVGFVDSPLNDGYQTRRKLTQYGREIEFQGMLLADIFTTDKLLVNEVQLRIKLSQNPDSFRLMAHNDLYQLRITDLAFKAAVCTVAPEVIKKHTEMLSSKPALYPFIKSDMKTFAIPAGMKSFHQHNVVSG
jgi:hypothetical protein